MALTKDSKIILHKLYREYLDKRNHGFSKSDSKNFGSAKAIHENYFPDLLFEDIVDSLRELGRNEFLDNLYADNTVYTCKLSDHAITTMENLPKETIFSVANFISNFIP